MTADEARAVAAFLGEPYCVRGKSIAVYLQGAEVPEPHRSTWLCNDGEVVLALLERAAALGLDPDLSYSGDCWFGDILVSPHNGQGLAFSEQGPTPLSALVAATVKYMEAQK